MRKRIAFLSFAAALVFCYSCSNDETIAVNNTPQENEISFRALNTAMTRADEMTSADVLKDFTVYAKKHGDNSEYFSDVVFTGPTTYTSAPKYYWPNYALDFYAYSVHTTTGTVATEDGQVTHSTGAANYLTFTITPNASAANQVDFVYATNNGGGSGVTQAASVPLTFTHKESKIVLKIKNSAANMSFAVTGWKVGFVKPSASTADGGTTWGSHGTATKDVVYTATGSKSVAAGASADAHSVAQILIPQETPTAVSGYTPGTAVSDPVNGAYIGIMYTATNTTTAETVADAVTGIWPLPSITWQPGYQYIYTIDIAQGGYYETNHDTDAELDPILGNFIQFASVTITPWTESDQGNVGM